LNDLIDTTEMYLRTIFELQEEGVPPLRARIAERLEHSGPTVSQTVARMQRDGLLHIPDGREIELTETGKAAAARVMRKHRLAECLLVDVVGLPWEQAHAEACRWEHVISNDVEVRLLDVLDHPTTSPFGNPIPALTELDPAVTTDPARAGSALWEVATDEVLLVRVSAVDEAVQSDPSLITAFHRIGLSPGGLVKCRRNDENVLVGSAGEYAEVPESLAKHIVVSPTRAEEANADRG